MFIIANSAWYEKEDELPFDLRHRRRPILYHLPAGSNAAAREAEGKQLARKLLDKHGLPRVIFGIHSRPTSIMTQYRDASCMEMSVEFIARCTDMELIKDILLHQIVHLKMGGE